jgi:cell division septation protein DedD
MGYTSGTAMEDRGLRDIERWRDKIEVRLDNRQVFFLFFGSALVACMLFVLGVIVGKRLESRGRAVSPEIEDPLALLDKVATSPRPAQSNVTFPQALFGTNGKGSVVDKHVKKNLLPSPAVTEEGSVSTKPIAMAAIENKPVESIAKSVASVAPAQEIKPEVAKPSVTKPESKPAVASKPENKPAVASKPESKPAVASKPENKPAVASKPESKPAVASKSENKPAVAAQPENKPALASLEAKPSEAKPVKAKLSETGESKSATLPTIASGTDSKGKGRFALQLSSFQDKTEAEAFAQKFGSEHPYLVVSDIPGKGIWYRVRVGDYASAKDAVSAKQMFEKKHNVIAYVAQK